MPPRSKQLLFSVLAVALFLAALELGARAFLHFSPGSRFAQIDQLCISLGLGPAKQIFEPDEDRFWRLRPSTTLRPPGSGAGSGNRLWKGRVADDRGFRAPVRDRLSKPERVVLCVGDSTTFGVGVEAQEAWPWQLQEALAEGSTPSVEVLNAGVPGYSSAQGKVYLEELLEEVSPQVVVVSFGINDGWAWGGMSDEEHLRARRSAPRRAARWFTENSRLASLFQRAVRPGTRSWEEHPDRWAKTVLERQGGASRQTQAGGFVPRVDPSQYRRNLAAMATLARDKGARPVFLVWPWYLALMKRRSPRIDYQLGTRSMASEQGVEVVDLAHRFAEARLDYDTLFLDGVHLEPEGNRLVAEYLREPVAKLLGQSSSR